MYEPVKNTNMNWKTFKEEKPKYDTPIFVYKTDGVFSFFKQSDDVRPCELAKKTETKKGWYYYLRGYDYGSAGLVGFSEENFNKLKWMPIPKP